MSNIQKSTGERLETFVFNDNTLEHLHRYAIAIEYIKGKTVLDIASGEGYGSNLMAQYAEKVFGVDIDEASVIAAEQKYTIQNLKFKVGRADSIPLEDASVDIVVSFETLEHHDKHQEMMLEIKRVLKPGGILIMSTPEKKYYTDEANYKNPFHSKELYLNEFKELINTFFNYSAFFYQRMFNGSLVISEEPNRKFETFSGDYTKLNLETPLRPIYNIVIASDKQINPDFSDSGFTGDNINVIRKEQMMNAAKQAREEGIEWIKKSWNYKIGNALLKPIRLFKK